MNNVDDSISPVMPNELRKIAGDEDLYVVMLPLWCDDVSGKKSKQYNKHINMYMANSNLPGKLLQQEYFVRFVSTSPHATSPEQFSALKEQIKSIASWYSLILSNPLFIVKLTQIPFDVTMPRPSAIVEL